MLTKQRILIPTLALATGAGVTLFNGSAFAGDPAYQWVEIPGVYDGFVDGGPINGAGQVTGFSGLGTNPPGSHMFRFQDGAGTENLDPEEYEHSVGEYINSRGQVAGYGCLFPTQSCRSYPIRHTPGVGLETLGAKAGFNVMVTGLNNFGDVVGSWRPDLLGHSLAFLYTDESGLVELPHLESDTSALAFDMNDAGLVVGSAYLSNPVREHAVMWENGLIHDLGSFGGNYNRANAVNESGVIVGRAQSAGPYHAFMYTDETGLIDIHPESIAFWSDAIDVNENGMVLMELMYTDYSEGFGLYVDADTFYEITVDEAAFGFWVSGMNNLGDVVGTILTEKWEARPFLWTIEGGTVMLDDLLNAYLPFPIVEAMSINDHGQIVANGNWIDDRALLLTLNETYTLAVRSLVAGEMAHLDVALATPNAMQYLVYSLIGPGETEVGALGVTLDLHQPRLAASKMADGAGTAHWFLPVPLAAQGRAVWFQAAEAGATTTVLSRTVR